MVPNRQAWFDKGMDLSRYLLEKGYTKAWFNWLEWITISAFFLTLGIKIGSIALLIISIATGILLFFTGLSASLKFAEEHAEYFGKKYSKKVVILLFILFIFIMPATAFTVLTNVLEAILLTGGG